MGETFRYWQFVGMDAAGSRRIEELPAARTFFEQQFPRDGRLDCSDAVVQRHLICILRRADRDAPAAATCLRCFISYQTDWICRDLAAQFGQKAGFGWADLFVQVLDDWQDSRPAESDYEPIAHKILSTFDPDQGQLSTWTKRLVKAELNPFLLDCGIYLASDWALLNGMKPESWERQCDRALRPAAQTRATVLILAAYHQVYRRDRRRSQGSRSRSKCLPPSPEQLAEMVSLLAAQGAVYSTVQLRAELKAIARMIRELRCPPQISIDTPGGQSLVDGPAAIASPSPLDAAADAEVAAQQAQLLRQYDRDLQACLEQALAAAVSQRLAELQHSQPAKAPAYLPALSLFHCQGLSMAKIGKELQIGTQPTVSRLLALDRLRANVRHLLLAGLRDRVLALAAAYLDRARLERLDQQLDDLLTEQIDPIIAEAETEASTPNRSRNSRFARSLCHHLDTHNPSP